MKDWIWTQQNVGDSDSFFRDRSAPHLSQNSSRNREKSTRSAAGQHEPRTLKLMAPNCVARAPPAPSSSSLESSSLESVSFSEL